MDLEYAKQKLASALESLVGYGTIQERVRNAWRTGLSMIDTLHALQGDAALELKKIQEGVVSGELPAQDALEYAQRILRLYERVSRAYYESRLKNPVKRG